MKKIKTIFDRDWEGNRGVINKSNIDSGYLLRATATEKLDGTNVRITVRNHALVRLEKRRNPSKLQKAQGIKEPWYVDADQYDPGDKFIYEAVNNTDLTVIPDGEWSGEAIGPKIQGNPLNLEKHTIFVFSLWAKNICFPDAPTTFDELKEWLPKQKSLYGNDCGIEGIVWHFPNGDMCKIKVKDFK